MQALLNIKSDISFLNVIKHYTFNKYISGISFIALTIIAIVRALQHYYIVDVFQPMQYTLWWHIPFNLFLWWSWFLFIPLIYWVTVRAPSESLKLLQWVIIYFLLPIIVIGIRQLLAAVITTLVLKDKSDFFALLNYRLFTNPWIWLDLIVYFAIVLGVRIIEYQRRNKLNELKLTQMQSQLVHSQLNALKSQLHPHFLFNTLNTISTLILKADNSEAERMLTLLIIF